MSSGSIRDHLKTVLQIGRRSTGKPTYSNKHGRSSSYAWSALSDLAGCRLTALKRICVKIECHFWRLSII